MKRVEISPITRLEGHGKIEIFLNDGGDVDRAFLQVPELRGFEKFCEGRLAEELPRITPRICGVCPTTHHMASTKAVDDMYGVEPTPTARKIRELIYNAFMCEDHLLHFYFLGGPDFVMGPDADPKERNILGVIGKVGRETAARVIEARRMCREIITTLGGKVIHPVCGLPGGVSRAITEEERVRFEGYSSKIVEFCQFTFQIFDSIVLKNKAYVELITGDAYRHETYYMGIVDEQNRVNFYDGKLRVVDPKGKEFIKFDVHDYLNVIAEHVEPWSYVKFPFLKKVGWKGFKDGADSGIFGVAPLGRLNASLGMSTPLAQKEYDRMYDALGGRPSGLTLAYHWARLVEALNAAERVRELASDKSITDTNIRNVPTRGVVRPGIAAVEAPRGTLFHHYEADKDGVITKVNLIVATQNNAGRIALSVDKAAKALIKKGNINQGILNMVEMAFRAYDPCMACSSHALPGEYAVEITIRDPSGEPLRTLRHGV